MTKQELAILMQKTDYKAWKIIIGEDKELVPLLLKQDICLKRLDFIKIIWFMGLRTKEIKTFIFDYRYTDAQLQIIAEGIKAIGLSKVKVYMNPKLSVAQMNALEKAYDAGLTIKRAKLVAKHEFNPEQWNKLIELYLNYRMSDEIANFIANPELEDYEMSQIVKCYDQGISFEKIKIIFESDIDKEVRSYFVLNYALKQEHFAFDFTEQELKILLNPANDAIKINIIADVIRSGIPLKYVKKLAKPCYNSLQMQWIYRGYIKGISDEEMSTYMSPVFDQNQMEEILKAIHFIHPDQIKTFADAAISYMDMEKIRKAYGRNDSSAIVELLEKAKSDTVDEERQVLLNLM